MAKRKEYCIWTRQMVGSIYRIQFITMAIWYSSRLKNPTPMPANLPMLQDITTTTVTWSRRPTWPQGRSKCKNLLALTNWETAFIIWPTSWKRQLKETFIPCLWRKSMTPNAYLATSSPLKVSSSAGFDIIFLLHENIVFRKQLHLRDGTFFQKHVKLCSIVYRPWSNLRSIVQ